MFYTKKEPYLPLFYPMDKDERQPFEGKFDPYPLLQDFFLSYDLDDIRYHLWRLIRGFLGNPNASNENETANYIYFYERCHDVLVACYLIAEQNQQSIIQKMPLEAQTTIKVE